MRKQKKRFVFKPNRRFLEESAVVIFRNRIRVFASELIKISSARDIDEMLAVLLKVFVRISKKWKLTPAQSLTLLGLQEKNPSQAWKYWVEKARVGKSFCFSKRNKLERLAYLVSIYKNANYLASSFEGAGMPKWFIRENHASPFFRKTPLEYMLQGDIQHLYRVCNYLESAAAMS